MYIWKVHIYTILSTCSFSKIVKSVVSHMRLLKFPSSCREFPASAYWTVLQIPELSDYFFLFYGCCSQVQKGTFTFNRVTLYGKTSFFVSTLATVPVTLQLFKYFRNSNRVQALYLSYVCNCTSVSDVFFPDWPFLCAFAYLHFFRIVDCFPTPEKSLTY